MTVDLNADLGEGGAHDAELMVLITSANICCGLHAGSPERTAETMELALSHGVSIGAHPGYHDPEHFGRRPVDLADEGVGVLAYQLGAMQGLARVFETAVRHVKPHGALFHRANGDSEFAELFVSLAARFALPVLGLPGSVLQAAAVEADVPYFTEGYADRRYTAQGTLVPRTEPNAMLMGEREVLAQVEWLCRVEKVQSICIHSDTPNALGLLRSIRKWLDANAIEVRAFNPVEV